MDGSATWIAGTALESRVLLDVLAVVVERRRADRLKLARPASA